MTTKKRGPGRLVDPQVEGRIEIAKLIQARTQKPMAECARMVAQADPVMLRAALSASPIDQGLALRAISMGRFAIKEASVSRRNADDLKEAQSAFPIGPRVTSSRDRERRVVSRRRRVGHINAVVEREQHPDAERVEKGAAAILQAAKNRKPVTRKRRAKRSRPA